VLSAAGQATDVALSAQAQTVMTNVGGGALDPLWFGLVLCMLCGVHLARRRTSL
jgi:hypothetical protein